MISCQTKDAPLNKPLVSHNLTVSYSGQADILQFNKIRATMRNRDKLYFLNHHVEADEAFVTTHLSAKQKAEQPKQIANFTKGQQGRGSDRKTPILVACESSYTTNDNKHKPNKAVKYIRMVGLTANIV